MIEIKLQDALSGASANTAEQIGVAVVVPIQGLIAGVLVIDRLAIQGKSLGGGITGIGLGGDVLKEEYAPPWLVEGGGVEVALEDVGAAVFVPIDSDGLVVLHAHGERIEAAIAIVKERLLGLRTTARARAKRQ